MISEIPSHLANAESSITVNVIVAVYELLLPFLFVVIPIVVVPAFNALTTISLVLPFAIVASAFVTFAMLSSPTFTVTSLSLLLGFLTVIASGDSVNIHNYNPVLYYKIASYFKF